MFQSQTGTISTPGASVTAPMALPEETPSPSPGLFSTFIRLILALGITLGLVVITIWGLKWVWESKGLSQVGEEGKPIRVFHTTYLGPRLSIQLVEIGSKVLVLGVGPTEIRCLDVIMDPREVATLKESLPAGFPQALQKILKSKEAEDRGERAQAMIRESNQAVGEYVQKLKNLKKKKILNTPPNKDT
ncbi:MAG TPA: flagellar biosynthetic protein FliO [bacterium]|nr:flagellar biosynthetic protein FliO [bacterium]